MSLSLFSKRGSPFLSIFVSRRKGIEKQASDFPPGTQFKSWGGETREWIQSSQIKPPKKINLDLWQHLTTCARKWQKCVRGETRRCVGTSLERDTAAQRPGLFWLHMERHPVMGYYILCGHLGAQWEEGLLRVEKEDRKQRISTRAKSLTPWRSSANASWMNDSGAQQMLVGWITQSWW